MTTTHKIPQQDQTFVKIIGELECDIQSDGRVEGIATVSI